MSSAINLRFRGEAIARAISKNKGGSPQNSVWHILFMEIDDI